MLKLENQLPFFVLEALFDLATAADHPGKSYALPHLAIDFFQDDNNLLPNSKKGVGSGESLPMSYHHLLHLFHSCLNPTQHKGRCCNLTGVQMKDDSLEAAQNSPNCGVSAGLDALKEKKCSKSAATKIDKLKRLMSHLLEWRSINYSCFGCRCSPPVSITAAPATHEKRVPCATELDDAGVEFKKKVMAESTLLDVTFELGWLRNGVMRIPPLSLGDETILLFRNLIAFEQCHPATGHYATSYTLFMNMIIDSPKDVALLKRKGVIIDGLGSDEQDADLFNKLCTWVLYDPSSFYLAGLFKDVKKHCDNRMNKWRATLMRDYFTNPWSFLSLVAAFTILTLTVLQTVYTIQGYYHGR